VAACPPAPAGLEPMGKAIPSAGRIFWLASEPRVAVAGRGFWIYGQAKMRAVQTVCAQLPPLLAGLALPLVGLLGEGSARVP